MIKKLCTLLLLTCMTAAPSMAQRYSSSDDASFVPKKGQWQVSVLLGSGKFFNENTSYLLPKFSNDGGVVGLPNGGTDNSGDLNRYLNIGSLNNNSLVNIAGIEGKYFVSDNWDVNFQFSMNVSLTPKKDYVEGDNSVPATNVFIHISEAHSASRWHALKRPNHTPETPIRIVTTRKNFRHRSMFPEVKPVRCTVSK